MISTIQEMLSIGLVVRVIIVGVLVSLCAALLGVSLVLKRYSNIGDGLSHVGYGIATVATAFGLAPLPVSIPGVIIVAVILLKIGNNRKIKSDSAIALISSTSLAIGVAVTSLTTGLNTDVCNFMFGSLFAMGENDVILSVIVSIIVFILFIIYYRKLFAVTFDEEYAKAIGLKVERYKNIIAILTAVVIVVGMRLMGALLISSVVIFPVLTSMRVFKSYRRVVISSGIVSVIAFLVGFYLSYVHDISVGASIVLIHLVSFIIFSIINKIIDS